MTKELLTIRFNYRYIPFSGANKRYTKKEITIGIFDTLEEAIEKGNAVLRIISKYILVKDNDYFSLNGGTFGSTVKLVSNSYYPTKGIKFFAEIRTLHFDDFSKTFNDVIKDVV